MNEPLTIGHTQLRRVAIVDDQQEYAEGTGVMVEDAGLEPVLLLDGYDRIEALVEEVASRADGVLCDHRLRPGSYATFDGAEAVAELYSAGVPGVLLTMYTKIDADVSIRLWRERIPSLLNRADMEPSSIRNALAYCARELAGQIPDSRQAWTAIIEVQGRENESGRGVLDVFVPGWRSQEAVRLPIDLLPVDLRTAVDRDDLLVCETNLGATRSEDLFFRNFRRARKPLAEDKLWRT